MVQGNLVSTKMRCNPHPSYLLKPHNIPCYAITAGNGGQALNCNEIRFPLACARAAVTSSCKSCENGFSKIDLTKKKTKTKNTKKHWNPLHHKELNSSKLMRSDTYGPSVPPTLNSKLL